MRQQGGLAQHQFAHGFEIVQRRLVAEVAQRLAHLGEEQFGLVAQAEERFGASELFAGAGDLEDFVGRHGVRAGVAGIAAEGAVSAIVAAEVGQRQENFARIGDDAGLEAFFGGAGGGEEFRKIVVGAANQTQSERRAKWDRPGEDPSRLLAFDEVTSALEVTACFFGLPAESNDTSGQIEPGKHARPSW